LGEESPENSQPFQRNSFRGRIESFLSANEKNLKVTIKTFPLRFLDDNDCFHYYKKWFSALD